MRHPTRQEEGATRIHPTLSATALLWLGITGCVTVGNGDGVPSPWSWASDASAGSSLSDGRAGDSSVAEGTHPRLPVSNGLPVAGEEEGGAPQDDGGAAVQSAIAHLDAEGYYGANLVGLGEFMVAHGYSKAGAAGIAGCVGGESAGNPESEGSGGGGLIGWTPLSAIYQYGGTIGGNPATDLANQFEAIVNYNQYNDPGSIGTLNAFADPVSAADFYSQVFERPAVLHSDVRADVANTVFAALGG